MSSPSVEILGRVERRRRFSVEQKLAVLREAGAPGVNISAVARWHGLTPSQVFKWRRLAELGVIGIPGASELPSFVAVQVAADDVREVTAEPPPSGRVDQSPAWKVAPSSVLRCGVIEIELDSGRRLRVDRDVDADALRRVLDALGER